MTYKYLLTDPTEFRRLNNTYKKVSEFFMKLIEYAIAYQPTEEDKKYPIPKPIVWYAHDLGKHYHLYRDTIFTVIFTLSQVMKLNSLDQVHSYPGYIEIPLKVYLNDKCTDFAHAFKTRYGLIHFDVPIQGLCDCSRLFLKRWSKDTWVLKIEDDQPNFSPKKGKHHDKTN